MEARWRGKGGEGTVLLDISLVASNAQLQTPTIGSWSRRAMEIGSSVRSAFPNLPVYLTPTIQGKKKRITKRIGRYAIVPISSLCNKRSATFPFPSSRIEIRNSKPPNDSPLSLFSSILRERKMEILLFFPIVFSSR